MSPASLKHCVVAYATTERQYLWGVELRLGASIQDAITAARAQAPSLELSWESAPVGIFGAQCARTHVPADGDRIEIYRALPRDPREERRERVRLARRAARRT
jgi:hypothetical protein